MEILWTGLDSLLRGDTRLTGTTSLWMFPIYGMAIFLEPFTVLLAAWPWVLRGLVYTLIIFSAEYVTGWWVRTMVGICPWDYSGSPLVVHGLIRLDYAPLWFIVGLLFERLALALR